MSDCTKFVYTLLDPTCPEKLESACYHSPRYRNNAEMMIKRRLQLYLSRRCFVPALLAIQVATRCADSQAVSLDTGLYHTTHHALSIRLQNNTVSVVSCDALIRFLRNLLVASLLRQTA